MRGTALLLRQIPDKQFQHVYKDCASILVMLRRNAYGQSRRRLRHDELRSIRGRGRGRAHRKTNAYDAVVGVPGLPTQEIDPRTLRATDEWIQPLNGLVYVFGG